MDIRATRRARDFEPTDEQLHELATRAFAGVKVANDGALEKLRAQIAAERERVLRDLDARGSR